MERTSCKTDFQSWKGIMALKLLCCNILIKKVGVPVENQKLAYFFCAKALNKLNGL